MLYHWLYDTNLLWSLGEICFQSFMLLGFLTDKGLWHVVHSLRPYRLGHNKWSFGSGGNGCPTSLFHFIPKEHLTSLSHEPWTGPPVPFASSHRGLSGMDILLWHLLLLDISWTSSSGHLPDIFWTSSGHLLDIFFWTSPGHFLLDIFWTSSGHLLDISWTYSGHLLLDIWTSPGHLLLDISWTSSSGHLLLDISWTSSSGHLLDIFFWTSFGHLFLDIFWTSSSGYLLDIFWTSPGHLPLDISWTASSGHLDIFFWTYFSAGLVPQGNYIISVMEIYNWIEKSYLQLFPSAGRSAR